jgi:hypothetical protein
LAAIDPPDPVEPRGVRLQVDGRAGILFAVRSGMPWGMPTSEIGCSGFVLASVVRLVSCRCMGAGIARLLKRPADAEKSDQTRAALNFSLIAVRRDTAIGLNPLDQR